MKWLFLLALLLPIPANAQQSAPAQGMDLMAFQASLEHLKTWADLESLDRARRNDSLSPAPLLERGFIALRLYEITSSRKDANRARQLFGTATDKYQRLPWAHYGLALALVRGPDVRIKSPLGVLNKIVVGQTAAEIIGLDPRSRAR